LLLFVALKGQGKGNVFSSTYVLLPSDCLGYGDQGQRGSNRARNHLNLEFWWVAA
jgi:hypothetical protein